MTLPKIDVPIYETTLISNKKKKIKFRSLTQKDKKIILAAYSGEDNNEIKLALKQVINNCIVTEGIDVEKLPWYDVQKIFLELRKKSIGSEYKAQVDPFPECEKENCPCKKPTVLNLSLDNIEVVETKDRTNKIPFSETSGMVLRDPTLDDYLDLDDENVKAYEIPFLLLQKCIESIYTEDTVTSTDNLEPGELEQFLDDLPEEYFKLAEKFFDTMPKIQQTIEYKCKECNDSREFTIERIQDFLG